MINAIRYLIICGLIVCLFPLVVFAWNCDVTIEGPDVIKKGQTIILNATGWPEGGSYAWSTVNNLSAQGASALLTAVQAPEYSEYIGVTATYTSPRGKKCSDRKYIWFCRCYTKITGPDTYKIGDSPLVLTASGDPEGGTFNWTPMPGLTADGNTVFFEGNEPGLLDFEVAYSPPDGSEPCYDTHSVDVAERCSVSLSGEDMVRQGDSIQLTADVEPEGGTFQWSQVYGLNSNGDSSAEFTGQVPGNVDIHLAYTPPDETESCEATHGITVLEKCSIAIEGPHILGVGETVTLETEGLPEGGSVYWPNIPELVNHGHTAEITGLAPGQIPITVTYIPNDGGAPCQSPVYNVSVIQRCDTSIDGPCEVTVGQSISLAANTQETGGTFEWGNIAGLVSNGNLAEFTAQEPGIVTISLTYTPPGAENPCDPIYHSIVVREECRVVIYGPTQIYRGETVQLTAYGNYDSGTYTWTESPGLIPRGSIAHFTTNTPGIYHIEVSYDPESGLVPSGVVQVYENASGCFASHTIEVMDFEIVSLSGKACVNHGATLNKSDFQIITNPSGFDDQVTIHPLSYSNLLSQTQDVLVTATKLGDEAYTASTNMVVVNSSNKTTYGVNFQIPNYIKVPLETIGLGDAMDLSFGYDFKSYYECCETPGKSTSGTYTVGLNIQSGPITIMGLPVPLYIKKYLIADVIAVSLTGKSDLIFEGAYKFCDSEETWNYAGQIVLNVGLSGGLKVLASNAIYIEGSLSGSTSISEKVNRDISNNSEFLLTTNWGGITITGTIKFIAFDDLELFSFTPSQTFWEKGNLAPTPIALPDLND